MDRVTKYVDFVMQWRVVPAYPVYLLTLLQAEKSSNPEDFKESGLGYYYQYLISDAMLRSGVTKDKLGDIEQYCSQLAWRLRCAEDHSVSIDELGEFNTWFSKEWVTLNFSEVNRKLLLARILVATGDAVAFRYSYLFYFFVAKYVADNFDNDDVQEFIAIAAERLYVRTNANILVFLTHFVTKPRVIDSILETLNQQFRDAERVEFARRQESVESLLRQLPEAVYRGGNPTSNRERLAREEDKLDDDEDGLVEKADELEPLSLPARLTVVFKSIEILGQILRTQYARINRSRRQHIISDMLIGPLRALGALYDILLDQPDTLVAEFVQILADNGACSSEDERKRLARRIVGSVVLATAFVFLRKTGDAVGADAVADDLRVVCDAEDDLGCRLVRLAVLLDSQKPLPRREIRAVRRLGSGSLIVERLVRILVVYRLYMFHTAYKDISWAREELRIPERAAMKALTDLKVPGEPAGGSETEGKTT